MQYVVRTATNKEASPTWVVASLFLIGLLISVSPSHATTIQFLATDLTNTIPGEDLWRYDYRVDNRAFVMDEGFFIEFDYNIYSNLQFPPPVVNSDWDPQVTQPDLILMDNGIYDALALIDIPSLTDLFSVIFVWSGGAAAPGSQPFTIYDTAFNPVETGVTTPAVPIPAPTPAVLIAFGLFGLAARRRFPPKTPSTTPWKARSPSATARR